MWVETTSHSFHFKQDGTGNPLRTERKRVFLLSPANASGARGKMIFSDRAQFDLALRVRGSGASLGEIYSFISGLYFRGKLRYAQAFANPPAGAAGIHVITAAAGLVDPGTIVDRNSLREISAGNVDASNQSYRKALERDASRLRDLVDAETEIVLLGSVASPKYVEPLLEVFEHRLLFPVEFVGRGDMSRGGLLLRCCSAGRQLEYAPIARATLRGKRPAKLPPNRQRSGKN